MNKLMLIAAGLVFVAGPARAIQYVKINNKSNHSITYKLYVTVTRTGISTTGSKITTQSVVLAKTEDLGSCQTRTLTIGTDLDKSAVPKQLVVLFQDCGGSVITKNSITNIEPLSNYSTFNYNYSETVAGVISSGGTNP